LLAAAPALADASAVGGVAVVPAVPAVPAAPAVPVVPAVVPVVPAVVSGALDGMACRHPVTVIFLSDEDDDGVVVCDGGVVCAASVTAAAPITAANVPDQIRFVMLPPKRPAACNPQTAVTVRLRLLVLNRRFDAAFHGVLAAESGRNDELL
jgi:hypothetical protein